MHSFAAIAANTTTSYTTTRSQVLSVVVPIHTHTLTMPLFGSSPPPSYAQEQLNHSLTALSTIPISIPVSVVGQHGGVTSNTSNTTHEDNTGLSTTIERVLGELSTSKPITRRQIEQSLETLVNQASAASVAPVDKVREAQIMARAVTVVWKESMQALVDESVRIEYAIEWWESTLQSGLQVAVYLIQSRSKFLFKLHSSLYADIHTAHTALPIRIWRLVPHPLRQSAFRIPSRNSLHLSHLFPTHHSTKHASSLRDLPLPAHNPLVLTRREILGSLKSLQSVRSEIAQRVGLLATGAPRWVEEASKTSLEQSQDNLQVVVAETNRLYALVVEAVGSSSNNSNNNQNGNSSNSNNNNQSIAKASPTPSPLATPTAKRSRREREVVSPPPPPTPLSATTLLPLLRDQLPETISSLSHPVLDAHSPPSRLVRLWVPMLLIPPLIHYSARSALVHKDWISSQLVNAGTTIRGWLVGWVIEPLSGVVATLQRGGQGLGVAPESVACDGASLERMVVDLGKDYYHLDQAQLDHLVSQVKQGDMEQVLKAYETEIKSPLRNALMGSLVRTLLIQVQKTKVG